MPEGSEGRLGILRRWASLLVIAAALMRVTVSPVHPNGPPIRADGVGYHVWTYAFLLGRLDFRWYPGNPSDAGLHLADPERGVYQNQYPPGVALVRLPVMAWLIDREHPGPEFSPAEHRAALILAGVALLAVATLVLLCCARLGVPPWASHTSVLLLTFGTGLFHYSTYDGSFSHIYSALGVALLMWLSVGAVLDGGGRLPATTALVAFLLVLVRNTNVVFLAIWAAGVFAWGWRSGRREARVWLRNGAWLAGGVGLAAAVQLGLNAYANGRLVFSSYGQEWFHWDRPMLASVLFSYERGLFTYYPVLGVVLVAGFCVAKTRPMALWLAVLFLAYATLYGFWNSWQLGGGFGHRGFVEFVPLAALLFALTLPALPRIPRAIVLVLAIASVCLTFRIMVGYWRATFPIGGADANLYWDHVLGHSP